MPISVAIITRDEEKRLAACLESISFAEEVLVVDSESRDRTVSIARSFGCRVLSEKWRGYARQKQFAVDNCSYDWVLILDADERVPAETREKIKEIVNGPRQGFSAYSFLRKNYFHDRWIRHCGWWPDRVVRLVSRRQGHLSGQLVHERWVSEGPIKELDVAIEHYSFQNYSALIHKMETYSTLAAEEMVKKGKRAGWWSPLTHGLWMFVRTYLLELGLLEGFDGFVISILNGGGSFLKYAKAREMMIHGQSSKQE